MTPENSNQSFPEPAPVMAVQAFGEDSTRPNKFSRWLALSFLCACVLVAAGVRLRLLDFPLERDEGEYAYAGQLIRAGIPPYELVYNMKMPGIYLAYAGLMTLFGETTAGIHFGLLMVHLATLAVLFLLARKLLDLPGAAVATGAYALMTLSPAYLGLAAHATHFVMLPALLGVWMVLQMESNGRVGDGFLAGCLFGTAFLMKQQGMFFGMFGGLWLAWVSLAGKMAWHRVLSRLGLYGLGCLLPFLAVCLWLKIAGVFPAFWFWTISYAREYVGIFSLHEGVERAKTALTSIFHAAPWLWMMAGGGLACLCVTRLALNRRLFLGGFLLFSALAVCPGFYFREHYFIVVVPAVALLAGLAVSWSGQWLAERNSRPWLDRLPFLLAMIACGQSLQADRAVLFSLSPAMACRAVYGVNPFPESPAVAAYLTANTRPDERVAVIGSEPQICFQAHRHSATGYIYLFPLMEIQPFARQMQENMIREIEQKKPAGLVLISLPTSWLCRQDSSHRLLDWVGDYLNQNMRQVGLIQYFGVQPPESVWGPGAATAPVRSDYFIAVFQRVSAGETTGGPKAIDRNKLLVDRLKNAQPDAAIGQYQARLRLAPNDLEARYNLGNLLAWKGQLNDAASQYQEVLRQQPDNADALDSLGTLFAREGQTDQAIRQFQRVLQLAPNRAAAHYNLGNALAAQGGTDAAIAQFQETIRLQPDNADAHNNLGNLLARTGRTEAAISELQIALHLQPDDADTHYNLGNVFFKAGRLDDAISEFQAAIRLKPDYAPAHYNLGIALNKRGQTDGAIGEFQEAIRRQPDYAIAHNSLGIALAAQGRLDDAIREFQAALRIKPDYASAQSNLAKAQSLKNQSTGPAKQ